VRSPLSVARSPELKSHGETPVRSNEQPTTYNASASAHRDQNLYPHWPWSWPIRLLRTAFIDLAMRPMVWLLAKPRVVYEPGAREALEKASALNNGERTTHNAQPFLLISNHITAYDGALVLYALPAPLRRRIAAAMSGEMLRDYRDMRNQGAWILNLLAPAAYWLLTALFNVFPLPRDRGFRRSFAHAGEAMDRGYSVLIFPEGTRSLTGRMNRFRSGIGLLAQQTEAPVLPIALRGIYDLVAEREATGPRPRWFHAGRIEIRIGAPIPAEELSALEPAALTTRLEDALRDLVESNDPAPMRIA
jgi:long-chain acyl-CoA synthetase